MKKKYKIKLERSQRGRKLDWSHECIVECSIPPKVGDGWANLIEPPILETITSVEEIKP